MDLAGQRGWIGSVNQSPSTRRPDRLVLCVDRSSLTLLLSTPKTRRRICGLGPGYVPSYERGIHTIHAWAKEGGSRALGLIARQPYLPPDHP